MGRSRAVGKGNGRWERLVLNGFCGLPRGGFFTGLGFGVESKLGLRLSGRLALGGLVGFSLCQLPTTPRLLRLSGVISQLNGRLEGELGSVCPGLQVAGGVQAPLICSLVGSR